MKNKEYHGTTLYKPFNILVDSILRYESDTFSASGNEITPEEAEKIAYSFVVRDIERRFATETMDGGMIDQELYELRQPVEPIILKKGIDRATGIINSRKILG